MPRGDKSKYTDKQKRQAEHIEEGYEEAGVPREEAESRAWATVNAMTGGGKKPGGSGRGKRVNKAPARKGGRIGGAASKRRATKAKKKGASRKKGAAKKRGASKKSASKKKSAARKRTGSHRAGAGRRKAAKKA